MQFTQSVSYPGTVDEVVAMYLTPDYLERRFGQFVVAGSSTVSVEGERVSFAGTVRPELIPSAASRFVKSDLRISFTEEWTSNEAGASSRTSVKVDGAPVSVEATSTLTGTETGCSRAVSGNVSVRVPLLGGRIEKEAVAHLGRVVEREEALAATWLAEHR
ncbi:DUF2505 domain-containing protein [Schaalia odontolytica]